MSEPVLEIYVFAGLLFFLLLLLLLSTYNISARISSYIHSLAQYIIMTVEKMFVMPTPKFALLLAKPRSIIWDYSVWTR